MRTTKRSAKGLAQVVPIAPPNREAILNELGRLHARLQAAKPLQDRYEQLRKQVVGWYENEAADKAVTMETVDFVVVVGARGEQRQVKSIRQLQKRMGAEFWKHATVPLSVLDKILAGDEQAEFLATVQTGPRRLTVTAKLVEEPLQAAA